MLGTPSYMAPEQAEGRADRIGRRTDVYGLGAILYEILAGQPPFDGESTPDVLRKVREQPPVPPSKVVRGAPKALEAVCLKAMAKDPTTATPRPPRWPLTCSTGWPTSRSPPGASPGRPVPDDGWSGTGRQSPPA